MTSLWEWPVWDEFGGISWTCSLQLFSFFSWGFFFGCFSKAAPSHPLKPPISSPLPYSQRVSLGPAEPVTERESVIKCILQGALRITKAALWTLIGFTRCLTSHLLLALRQGGGHHLRGPLQGSQQALPLLMDPENQQSKGEMQNRSSYVKVILIRISGTK